MGISGTPEATGDAQLQDDFAAAFPLGVGAWTAYTPSNTNVTVSNGTQVARYHKIGKTVHWEYKLVLGSSSSFGAFVRIGLPTGAKTATNGIVGMAYCEDTDGNDYIGVATTGGVATECVVHLNNSNNLVGTTAPFTWAAGDTLVIGGTYEEST